MRLLNAGLLIVSLITSASAWAGATLQNAQICVDSCSVRSNFWTNLSKGDFRAQSLACVKNARGTALGFVTGKCGVYDSVITADVELDSPNGQVATLCLNAFSDAEARSVLNRCNSKALNIQKGDVNLLSQGCSLNARGPRRGFVSDKCGAYDVVALVNVTLNQNSQPNAGPQASLPSSALAQSQNATASQPTSSTQNLPFCGTFHSVTPGTLNCGQGTKGQTVYYEYGQVSECLAANGNNWVAVSASCIGFADTWNNGCPGSGTKECTNGSANSFCGNFSAVKSTDVSCAGGAKGQKVVYENGEVTECPAQTASGWMAVSASCDGFADEWSNGCPGSGPQNCH